MFTGGTNIDPLRFNEPIHNETVEVDPWRDEAEWQLATELLNSDLPIFAICRGMQFLNVVLGGTLIQDLPTQFPTDIQHKQVEPRSQETHEIVIEDGSWLSRISGLKTAKVNSMHHQAVKDIATSLTVTSAAPDGIVESYETFEGRWLVGVQFHPEELIKENELSIKLFHEFVRICQEKA